MTLRDKIIDAAYEVFAKKGYEDTTISDIIKEAGGSRGGFYHHFKSKEEILEGITNSYIEALQRLYDSILNDKEASVIDLLNQVFVKINAYKVEQSKDWPKIRKVFSYKGNETILKKLFDQFEVITSQTYLILLERGIQEGLFQIDYPKELAGLLTREMMRLYRIMRKLIYMQNKDLREFENTLEFNESLLKDLLGFEKKQIHLKEVAIAYVVNARKQIT